MEGQIIIKLAAQKGTKYGENGSCIGNYFAGTTRRQTRHIVFFPKGVEPDKEYRVELTEIRRDSAGYMMYAASPASVEYTERWKDLGDGKVGLVTIATDWLLQESEEGIRDERPAAEREVPAETRFERNVVWGQDLASSYIEQVEIKVFHTQRETVVNGALQWEKIAEREERGIPTQLTLTRVDVGYGDLAVHMLDAVYQDSWSVTADARYSAWDYVRENTVWGNLPAWLQNQVTANYPVCVCGRSRRGTEVSDGYGKCETCRAEEICIRCGKQAKVTNLDGRLICNACKPMEEQEQLTHNMFTPEHLAAIAKEAENLLPFEPATAEFAKMVLKTGLEFMGSDYDRKRQLESEEGYHWYYFTPEGVFGSKFDKAALTFLAMLPFAKGNSLVEMVAWFANGLRAGRDYREESDYYTLTQTQGNTDVTIGIAESQLKGVVARIDAGQGVLAVSLRGSEKERKQLADWLAETQTPQSYNDCYGKRDALVKAGQQVVTTVKGYHAVLQQIAEYTEWVTARQARQEAGEIWMDVLVDTSTRSRVNTNVWAIAPDGTLLEPLQLNKDYRGREECVVFGDIPTNVLVLAHTDDNYGYRYSEDWKVVKLPARLTAAQIAKAEELADSTRQYFAGNHTGFDLTKVGHVCFTTQYYRDLWDSEKATFDLMISEFPIDTSKWDVVIPTRTPNGDGEFDDPETRFYEVFARENLTPEEKEYREQLSAAEGRVRYLQGHIAQLEREWEEARQGGRGRMLLTWSTEEYKGETKLVCQTSFSGTLRVRQGEGQPDAFIEYEGPVKLVCNKWMVENSENPPQTGQTWVCTIGRKIGQAGAVPVVVANPQWNTQLVSDFKDELIQVEKALKQLRVKNPTFVQEAFAEDDSPNTAMAAAFKKVLKGGNR